MTATTEALHARLAAESVMQAGRGDRHLSRLLDEAADALEQQASVPSAEPPFDMLAHLQRQAEFSAKTFGPGARVEGVTDHIAKELREVRESGGDLSEWVDVIILAFDGAWRSGASPAQIIDAMVAKQTKNEGRKWPDWRTAPADKAIEHDRSGEVGTTPLMANGLTETETAATASVAGLVSTDGMPARAPERYLRRLLAGRVAIPGAYYDDGEAHGAQHGISIDFMREPVADIDAKLRALDLARYECATPPAPSAPTVQPLPARLVRFTLRDLKTERKRLDSFISLGNEIERAAEYDEWIAALQAYCTAHCITAAPTKETP